MCDGHVLTSPVNNTLRMYKCTVCTLYECTYDGYVLKCTATYIRTYLHTYVRTYAQCIKMITDVDAPVLYTHPRQEFGSTSAHIQWADVESPNATTSTTTPQDERTEWSEDLSYVPPLTVKTYLSMYLKKA